MITQQTCKIYDRVQRSRLEACLTGITAHHRIQASPGYHAAAEFCCRRLCDAGLSSEILTYPAREGVFFQNSPSFDYWACRSARCTLPATGEVLADYGENPFSIIQRSGPCADRELEIVDLDRGTEESAYDGIDFTGKLVFVHGNFASVRDWAIGKRGALGYLTDYVEPEPGVRDRDSMHAIRRYTSFWWRPGEKRVFGFVLTPDQGDRLHAHCLAEREAGRAVKVRCQVDSEFRPGEFEIVTAHLPGTSEEEILLVAHLCHPFGSANDNASGASAILEAIILLKEMIEQGELQQPRFGIRVLLVPEILGSYAWLDGLTEAERGNLRLALTCDMVGAKQENRGPVTLYETPLTSPGIGNPLAALILKELRRDVFSPSTRYKLPMWNAGVCRYIDGSDHGVLNDPALGCTSPLLCQWPDASYHTDADIPEVIDYAILQHSCALAASYAYHAASLSPADLPHLAHTNYLRMQEVLTDISEEALAAGSCRGKFLRQADAHLAYYQGNLRDLRRFLAEEEQEALEAWLVREEARLSAAAELINDDIASLLPEGTAALSLDPEDSRRIPERAFFGRLDYGFGWIRQEDFDGAAAYRDFAGRMGEALAEDMDSFILYCIDGKRSIADIAARTSSAFGTDAALVTREYLALLEEAGLIVIRKEFASHV